MRTIESNLELLVGPEAKIRDSLKKIDANSEGILFVVDNFSRLIGSLTDGDIRRSLLAGKGLSESIEGTYNTKPFSFIQSEYNNETAKKVLVEKHFEIIPIVTSENKIVGYITWNDLLAGTERRSPGRPLDVPVVIMAGGKGTRMVPFTNVLPKPLIPIGEKTILELIIDEFRRYNISNYFFTINYRAEIIQAYFDCLEHDYKITYLKETDFWGTAGSLNLLPKDIGKTIIVSNCDIIVSADFAEVMDFHNQSNAKLTILSAIQHHKVPYGVIEFESGGRVLEIEEKPEFTFCINTGVYVIETECLKLIPEHTLFHMTHLIDILLKAGEKVVTYPVNESEYIDIGQWEEYHRAVKLLSGTDMVI